MYESPISIISQMVNEQIREVQNQEENAIVAEISKKIGVDVDKDELIRALNYDRHQYEKGYVDGRLFGIHEVMSKVKRIGSSQAIQKERFDYYDEKSVAEYKEFIKRHICDEIGRYLYENNLVTFTESNSSDDVFIIIRADVQVYDENKEEGETDDT